MRRVGALMAALMLAGCLPEAEVPPTPDSCGAAALQDLLGQPEAVLATMRFAQPLRIIHPGDAVTMDFSEGRLNILIDAEGRISALNCG